MNNMSKIEEFTEQDLLTMRKALAAYVAHLTPSASHVREVAEWLDKVSNVEYKVTSNLLAITSSKKVE